MLRKLVFVCALFFMSGVAFAQAVNINVGQGIYSNYGPNTLIGSSSVFNSIDIRIATGFSIAGVYRTEHGPASLPIGTVISVTYPDGTSEKFLIVSLVGSVQAVPIVGSQKDAEGNTVDTCEGGCTERPEIGAGGNEGGGGWFSNVINFILDMLSGKTRTGRVIVGDIEQ